MQAKTRVMNKSPAAPHFSELFDRALAACARAQELSDTSTEAAARARRARTSARRTRALVAHARAAWADSDAIFSVMRHEVEAVAADMRAAGFDKRKAAAEVRAHVRFVLYDGGLPEAVAEPLVQRASDWVTLLFAA